MCCLSELRVYQWCFKHIEDYIVYREDDIPISYKVIWSINTKVYYKSII